MNTLKGRNDSCVSLSSSVFPDFTRHKTAVGWKGTFSFLEKGMNSPLWGEAESKFHIESHCPPRRNRSIYLACSLSTCFLVWEDPMESLHWVEEWKKFFSLFLSPFFSVTMMLQVPWGCSGPDRGEQRHRKQRALQLHACGPLRLPPGTKQRPT